MYRNQMTRVIFHLPLVIDDIFQFNLRGSMIMYSGICYNFNISIADIVATMLVAYFKRSVNKKTKANKLKRLKNKSRLTSLSMAILCQAKINNFTLSCSYVSNFCYKTICRKFPAILIKFILV